MTVQMNATDVSMWNPCFDRRTDGRHRLMLRAAKLCSMSGEYVCVVHDVSQTGAKLRLFHEHPPEDFMFLQLSGGFLVALERRWINGEYAGFRFSCKVDVADFIREKVKHMPRPLRLCIQQPNAVHGLAGNADAVLVDLSAQGACIETGGKVSIRERVNLVIGDMPARVGHVCWHKRGRFGVVFQAGLGLKQLASAAHALQPYSRKCAVQGIQESEQTVLCA